MLVDKLNEFKAAVDAIKVALIAQGVAVSAYTLASAAQLVGQVQTSRSMGSKSVTFKQNAIIYGIKITESESDPEKRVAYTDDAKGMVPVNIDDTTGEATYYNWDKTWIFDHFTPVLLNNKGKVECELDPTDYRKKITGESIYLNAVSAGNTMIQIDKFYIKFSMSGENECIQISNAKLDGFEPIGFYREDSSEADKIFIGAFKGYIDSQFNNGKLRSVDYSTPPTVNSNLNSLREAAQKNGSGYDIESWAHRQMLQAVFLVLMKNTNAYHALKLKGTSGYYGYGVIGKNAIYSDPNSYILKFMYLDFYLGSLSVPGGTAINGILSNISKNNYKSTVYFKMKPPYNDDTSGYTSYDDGWYIYYINGFHYTMPYIKKMKCSNETGRIPVEYTDDNDLYKYEGSQWVLPIVNDYNSYNGYSMSSGFSGLCSDSSTGRLTYTPPA